MPPPDALFRRQALQRVSSPEQLDSLITVVNPLGWLVLATLAGMVLGVVVWGVFGRLPVTTRGSGLLLHEGGVHTVRSLASGMVTEVLVSRGETVRAGQEVARLRATAEVSRLSVITLTAPFAGEVVQVLARPGQVLGPGEGVLNLVEAAGGLTARLYVSATQGKRIRPGMEVSLRPSSVDSQKYGSLLGDVAEVAVYASTPQQLVEELGNESLARAFEGGPDPFQGAPLRIEVRLRVDERTPSGYGWSSAAGPPFQLSPDTPCEAQIVTDSEAPIDLVIPYLLKRFGAGET